MQERLDGPVISVLFPTYGRNEIAHALLRRLADQTVDPESFEVIVVDDGSTPAIELPHEALPYACTLLRQENAGPASARNHGLEHCRGELVLILNDDAVPANDLIERHLKAHAELGPNKAVLGTFGFTEEALQSAFTRLLEESTLLFAYAAMEDGGRYGWDTFWTCNISLATEAIRAAGGFDAELFDRAICEDVELGARLCSQGLEVVHRTDCFAEHDHRLNPRGYMERAFILGIYQCRLGKKFGQHEGLFQENAFAPDGGPGQGLRPTLFRLEEAAYEAIEALEDLEREYEGREIPDAMRSDAIAVTNENAQYFRLAGLYYELTGEDVRPTAMVTQAPPPATAAFAPTPGHAPNVRPGVPAELPAARPVPPTPVGSAAAAAAAVRGRAAHAEAAPDVPAPSEIGLPSRGPGAPALSLVVVSCDAFANTRRCIESLRAAEDPRFPQEIIVVDNGSTDGSLEWLRDQDDVQLVENPTNHGAPRARNQGIRLARGEWIAFFDNDVVVPRSWVVRTLEHARGNDDVGSIPLVANRASKHQVVAYDGDDSIESIETFANTHYGRHAGESVDATLFTSLAVVVRRAAVADIGGFDEAFSPWGFEDDDYSLRLRLAGWRNLVARDSFVYHAAYGSQEKHERHAAWLQDNWDAFLAKWCPSAAGAPLFDYERVTVPQLGEATREQLVFALPADGAPAPRWRTEDGISPAAPLPAPGAPHAEAPTATVSPADVNAAPAPPRTSEAPRSSTASAAVGARPNVVVMGCGRSGTSLATGLFADAGWFVGDDPWEGRGANPKGFFETPEINGINEYLLAGRVPGERNLGAMQHWLALAPEPVELRVDPELRARMDRLTARGPFAFKDPRFSYTLEAWRPSLGDAKYVCVFREPAVTAASILKETRDADYLADMAIDFDRAVAVWTSMYRRILDEHAHTGEWLFVHFDELLTPEGIARVEAFVGARVAGDFGEARFKRSKSDAPVPAETAALYRELCAKSGLGQGAPRIAEVPGPRVHTTVAEPEMTVLICTYNRKDVLERCLASFENQTASGRYEIVVVDDGSTDGTAEMLDARPQAAPTRLIHQANGGLSAARNAGLRVARGRYVLLCNDDTIAHPGLIEAHLARHARSGPHDAVLGTFEQPSDVLDGALMRVLEESSLVFCYDAMTPGETYDWTRFWTCNVSVPLDDVRTIGLFDESFRHYGCEDSDLGYRLEKEFGMRVHYETAARAEHDHVLDFDDLERRNRQVASAFVRLFFKHPELLSHRDWRGKARVTLRENEDSLIAAYPVRAKLEQAARALAAVDVGALERAGEAEYAHATLQRLAEYLAALNELWWAEGLNAGMRTFGIDAMAEIFGAARRRAAEERCAERTA